MEAAGGSNSSGESWKVPGSGRGLWACTEESMASATRPAVFGLGDECPSRNSSDYQIQECDLWPGRSLFCSFSASQAYVNDVVEIEIWPAVPDGEREASKGVDNSLECCQRVRWVLHSQQGWEGVENKRCKPDCGAWFKGLSVLLWKFPSASWRVGDGFFGGHNSCGSKQGFQGQHAQQRNVGRAQAGGTETLKMALREWPLFWRGVKKMH